jgi:hypothetical protein
MVILMEINELLYTFLGLPEFRDALGIEFEFDIPFCKLNAVLWELKFDSYIVKC